MRGAFNYRKERAWATLAWDGVSEPDVTLNRFPGNNVYGKLSKLIASRLYKGHHIFIRL